MAAFKKAWEGGNVTAFIDQLDADAQATIDGGGKVSAAPEPVIGAELVARLFLDIYRRQPDLVISESTISGQPGSLARDGHGRLLGTVSFGLVGSRIGDLWVMRNPDKLMSWAAGS